ncbi:hypothetical protein [Flavihumibacter petaseus]|uniref:Uncharacterized protein n=1 Tax=Flavihumibacter petaseus NBRC 106054 TaxID=1220578 RepID=A0A0E9MY19_9BACT|nr:hypothetical protein [Flavihumibacter petaseus]GAO42474.1 hypothetical protein FPE01S_01_14880 [Flavihumibacter petaseus NBRC 106054]
MKAATVQEIKTGLEELSSAQVSALCLRLVKFKKENKELVTYMLFESGDQQSYVNTLITEMEQAFGEINQSTLYLAKKSLRRLLREANKHIRYIGEKTAEVDLLMAWCRCLKQSGIPFQKSTALDNLYKAQLKKVRKIIEGMHEDLQYDYSRALKKLSDQ